MPAAPTGTDYTNREMGDAIRVVKLISNRDSDDILPALDAGG